MGEQLTVETDKAATLKVGGKSELGARGSKGKELLKRGKIALIVTPPPALPQLSAPRGAGAAAAAAAAESDSDSRTGADNGPLFTR